MINKFENLGDRLQNVMSKIKVYVEITEDNISEMLRKISLALLEADVNYKVVKEFTNSVKEKALGEEVKKSIKPGDLFVKIVNGELVELLGGEEKPLNLNGNPSILGLKPMSYFHPHGLKYEFQMNGPNKVILVSENAKELNVKKHYIRNNMTRIIQNHFVNWFNGEKVLWDTNLNTNLVHTTDDSTEACIHLLSGYPEYQLFTRFNYPNPVLRKEKRK